MTISKGMDVKSVWSYANRTLTELTLERSISSSTIEQTQQDKFFELYPNGTAQCVGEKILIDTVGIKGKIIDGISFYLKRVGSPSGKMYATIMDDNWNIIRKYYFIDMEDVSTTGSFYTAKLGYWATEDIIRLFIEADLGASGDSSNYVEVGYYQSNVWNGGNFCIQYTSGSKYDYGWDLTFKLTILDCQYTKV